MNINTIRAASPPQVSWTTSDAHQKDADFLTLRLLNKRTRARLSPQPLDPSIHDGRGNYFVISSTKGWFAAISRSDGRYQLSCSPLNELRESIVSSKAEGEDDFVPKRVVSVAGAPVYLALALNDERLVVGFSDGSLSIHDTSVLFSYGANAVEPLRTFPPGPRLRQIMGNPGDLPELVAIRRDVKGGSSGMVVEILNVKDLQSVGGWKTDGTPETIPTSIVWSAKGKQLAIGLKCGAIVTYSPLDTSAVKLHVPKPPAVGNSSAISVLWLSNQAFYGIYAPVDNLSPEAPQKHVLSLYDPKATSATQIELDPPYYASPALRPPGAFTVVLRNWNPSKVLIFIGDSTSSDIGLIGSISGNNASEAWCNLALEETSTPSVPLDKDAEDTVPLSLDVDLTTGHGERDVPILYLYASDGTLQAWFVSNAEGGTYPGMISPSSTAAIGQTFHSVGQATPPFLSQPTAPAAFRSTGFGTAATFGQPSIQQQAEPTSGSNAISQQAPAPDFAQPSSFGQPVSASSFGQNGGIGFGAFASSNAPKFGSTGFGFSNTAQNPPSAPAQSSVQEAASPEAEMSEESTGDVDKLGGLSLGGSEESKKNQDKSVNSMFGSFTQGSGVEPLQLPSFGRTGSPSSFGAFGNAQGSGFIKPASGFGAYLRPSETQSADNETKPSSAFGASGFGTSGFRAAKAQPDFGQPAFGQSSFGSPAPLGKVSPFGSSSPASAETSTAGFSAFAGASKGFSSFAQGGTSGFAQQTSSLQAKPSEAPTISMASSSEDAGNESSPTLFSEQKSPSPVVTPKGKFLSSDATKVSSSSFGTTTPRSTSSESQGLLSGTNRQKQSAFSTPVARGQSPISSPEGTPKLERKSKPEALMEESFSDLGDESISSLDRSLESTTPFGTPAPSIFKTTGSVPTGGAFGNLTTTPSAFRPAEGFGAFGWSAKSPNSSPFANPKPASNSAFTTPIKPASAFGAGGLGPSNAFSTTPADSSTPKFGTPSTPKSSSSMFGKSSFATPATPSPISTTPLTTPKGNAFTAYSGSGGFSAFAKVDKAPSFSDLLKSQKDEDTATSALSKPQSSDKDEKEKETSFASISKPEEAEQDNLPPTPSTHGTFDEEEQDLGEEHEGDDSGSFISESFSEEAGEEAEEDAEGDEDEDDEEAEEEEEESEEEESEEGEGEKEEERESKEVREGRIRAAESATRLKAPSPASIALPPSRESTPASSLNDKEVQPGSRPEVSEGTEQTLADSAKQSTIPLKASNDTNEAGGLGVPTKSPAPLFPKSGTSGIPTLFGKPFTTPENTATKSASPSPPPSLFGKQPPPSTEPASKGIFSKPLANVRSESTTPPGSPSKPDEEPITAPKAVTPTASSSAPSGLGRPSSQPARSSPLAGVPLSEEESKPVASNQLAQPASGLKPRPASPKMPFGQLPSAVPQQSSSALAKPFDKQEPSTAASAPKQATFGTAPASPSAGNAPFIMPASAPGSLTGKPGASAFQGAGPVRTPSQQAPATTYESVLQKECDTLNNTMNGDLARVQKVRESMRSMSSALGKSKSEIHTRDDLYDHAKWSMGDLGTFTSIVKGLEEDALAAVRTKNAFAPALRDLESNLLKAETRKEEVIRFSKAKSDPEFLRMLKTRTLSPDVAETRSQLRRQIRMMEDRIEKLEAHLKACKKKLEEHKKGKASIKPPPLDTLNRIYRNIDLALESQTEQIAALASRIERLDINEVDATLYRSPSSRRKPVSKTVGESVSDDGAEEDWDIIPRPQVTTSIAASTAAALNAERSAVRLKNALLKARQAPLLNTSVGQATRRVEPPLDMSAALSNVSLDLSLDGLRTTKNAGQRQRTVNHERSVTLRHGEVPKSIASFDWGPLPLPSVQPKSALPFQIKP